MARPRLTLRAIRSATPEQLIGLLVSVERHVLHSPKPTQADRKALAAIEGEIDNRLTPTKGA